MNARERVIAAIQHKGPDRQPVDFDATPSSCISAIAYDQLKTYLRICGPTRVYDMVPPENIIAPFEAIDEYR